MTEVAIVGPGMDMFSPGTPMEIYILKGAL